MFLLKSTHLLVIQSLKNEIYDQKHQKNRLEHNAKYMEDQAEDWRNRYHEEQENSRKWHDLKIAADERLDELQEKYHELAMQKCPKKLKDRINELEGELKIASDAKIYAELKANTFKEAMEAMKGGK